LADISELLQHLINQRASDLHLKPKSVPFLRVNGRLRPSELPEVSAADTEELIQQLLPPERAERLRSTGEVDFAVGFPGVGRFRLNVMRQRGSASLAIRRVLTTPPSFDALGLPAPVHQLAERSQGLLLVTGPTNSGKSTTVATMLDHINEREAVNIICIERPIEMLHADKKSFISQREVGTDTDSHLAGLQQALRHDPEVIYVDQISDPDTMELALAAATGNLVIGTLPTLNAEESVRYVLDLLPERREQQIRAQLASVLQGIVSQRLISRADGRGRIGAFEFMMVTTRMRDAILRSTGALDIETIIETGEYYGMQTLDQHLALLHRGGMIGLRDALSAATHPQELRVALQQADA